jgi:hypothetical protein
MALPPRKKKIIPDIGEAVQKAAGIIPGQEEAHIKHGAIVKKTGRPSPRSGKIVRQTLLLSEGTSEKLTMALAEEQIKRRKTGEKVDKSLLIEEAILAWLEKR